MGDSKRWDDWLDGTDADPVAASAERADLVERLTEERDRAREECGVWKHKAKFYEAEMYLYLEKLRKARTE